MSDQLTTRVAHLIAMTDDEFYTACEAIGLTIHDDRTPEPNNIRSITQ